MWLFFFYLTIKAQIYSNETIMSKRSQTAMNTLMIAS